MKDHFYGNKEAEEQLAEAVLSTLEIECSDDKDKFVSLSQIQRMFPSNPEISEFRKKYGSPNVDNLRTAIKVLYDSNRVIRAKITDDTEFYRPK